jgi:hypothetical protein
MSCVNISVTPDDEVLRKPRHSGKRTLPSHPSMVSGDTMTRNNKQAGDIDRALTILTPLPNTPPQVDEYTYVSRVNRLNLSNQHLLLKISFCESNPYPYQLCSATAYVQMYLCPVDLYSADSGQSIQALVTPVLQARPVFESDQGNWRSEPKPDKKKPEPKPDRKKPEPKPDKKKPGREGRREPREPRGPNAKAMSSIFFRICRVS